ncbi:MAG: AbrB family transcriptional regulator [Nocardioidaceae bacterium]|nr:AbrB family transcriptional regulator [Nocardioidaceae bacterium]
MDDGEGDARRPLAAVVRAWAVVLVVGAAVSGGLALAGLPSPVLFGALAGGIAQAITGRTRLEVPGRAFQVGQGLLGATIGGLVSITALQTIAANWWQIALVTLATLVVSMVAGQGLRVHRDVNAVTGAFALVAGGASGIVAVARELGADERVVTVIQYLRVLVVLLAMPVVTAVVFSPPTDGAAASTGPSASLLADLALCVLAVVVGLGVARLTHLPAGALLGPLVVSVVLTVTGVLGDAEVPVALQQLAYALIGVQVGLRFTRESLQAIARMLPLATALIVAVIAACAGFGLLLSEATGASRLDGYLATTPGGLYAVLATAVESGGDVTFVLAVQVIRLFAVLLVAPLIARALLRRR